jgi:pentatricopeptide repeat protein
MLPFRLFNVLYSKSDKRGRTYVRQRDFDEARSLLHLLILNKINIQYNITKFVPTILLYNIHDCNLCKLIARQLFQEGIIRRI